MAMSANQEKTIIVPKVEKRCESLIVNIATIHLQERGPLPGLGHLHIEIVVHRVMNDDDHEVRRVKVVEADTGEDQDLRLQESIPRNEETYDQDLHRQSHHGDIQDLLSVPDPHYQLEGMALPMTAVHGRLCPRIALLHETE